MRRFLDDPAAEKITAPAAVDGDHGRIETRTATVSTTIDWLQEGHQWPGLKAIGKIVRTRETGTKTTTETAYYLLSAPLAAERFGEAVRAHWGIENRLHWMLDVTMNEDQAENRLDNGPNNLAVLRHMALNILNAQKSRISNRRKSNGLAGATPSWQTSSLKSEMRLPCTHSYAMLTSSNPGESLAEVVAFAESLGLEFAGPVEVVEF